MERFEVYEDLDHKLRFNMKDKHKKILAISEPFDSMEECKAAIADIKDKAVHCKVVELDIEEEELK